LIIFHTSKNLIEKSLNFIEEGSEISQLLNNHRKIQTLLDFTLSDEEKKLFITPTIKSKTYDCVKEDENLKLKKIIIKIMKKKKLVY
jgi:hypothetical protein